VDTVARRPKGELRERILAATIELLHERSDPALVSIDAVVTTVGCTPPALYYYFPTKEQLLSEACRLEYAAFAADLDAATPRSDDALSDLGARGDAYITWARTHPAAYRHLFMTPLDVDDEPPPTGPDGFPDLSEVPGLGSLVADLRRAREAGVPVGDPNLTAFALWGVVHGFASLAVTQPDIPHDWLVLGLHRAYAGLLHGED
jgi:AcrR family transcriptional regulator